MKTSICFKCKCQALCPTGQVQPREATVSAITTCFRFQPKVKKDKQTRADRVRGMSDEELAEFMASQVVAMADAIFGIAERVLMEKRGYKISFTDNFTPDLVEIKREYLEMLRQEVEA